MSPWALMRTVCLGVVFSALVTIVAAADKPSREPTFLLVPQRSFLKLPAGFILGECSAVAINKQGEIYLFHRGPRPILCFDARGNLLRSWGDDVITTAHGLRLDADENIWTTDVGSHRVCKFDPRGQLLLTLGNGEPGAKLDQFNKPTDIAFGSRGEVYVSDGYLNSRVLKFDREGKLLASWGTEGNGKGQFRLPHSIVVNGQGHVLVGDRENDRIQVFDADGKWLATWKGFAPYGMAFDPDGLLFVADGRAAQILLLDDQGKVRRRWGHLGEGVGEFQMPHMLGFDPTGNLYVAEVDGKRLQQWIRKARDMKAKP